MMKTKILKSITIGLTITAAIATHATASPFIGSGVRQAIAHSTAMVEGGRTMAPLGHIVLCMNNPSECKSSASRMTTSKARAYLKYASLSKSARSRQKRPSVATRKKTTYAPVRLTPRTWAQLSSINKRINAKIKPRSDGNNKGIDVWSVSGNTGDCEDYALQKRRALIRAGWPSHSVLMTVADHPRYGSHAVLIARTNNGDFVLDNMRKRVVPWNRVNYRWKKRQSQSDPSKWVRISSGSRRMASNVSYTPRKQAAKASKSRMVKLSQKRNRKILRATSIKRKLAKRSYRTKRYSAARRHTRTQRYVATRSITRKNWATWAVRKQGKAKRRFRISARNYRYAARL
jgi:predicted transglutaminase-like cysteine proteinase